VPVVVIVLLSREFSMSPFFRIKICGITRLADAAGAVAAGADAIGLNFYPGSPRCITAETAAAIVHALPPALRTVGVFVNAPIDQVLQLVDRLGLHFIQLHGDEPPEYARRLAPRPVIRAFRLRESASPLLSYISECRQIGLDLSGVLVDAYSPGALGGTGAIGNWGETARIVNTLGHLPLVLAGGLSSENVADAIAQVRPAAVDVASGVEREPGHKDEARMRRFVAAALSAWETLP
jgi:phosphoribosylanthranilate isomerase